MPRNKGTQQPTGRKGSKGERLEAKQRRLPAAGEGRVGGKW